LQIVTSGQSGVGDGTKIEQRIENVRTLAGQTATVSFWAKAASGTPGLSIEPQQSFGSGGSSTVLIQGQKVTLSTSWARYSLSFNIPSISGKTIGSDNSFTVNMWVSSGSNRDARLVNLGIQSNTFQIWGVQVESGSTATAFQTATGTIQGELAACQRYYVRLSADATATGAILSDLGVAVSTTQVNIPVTLPVQMRVAPTALDFPTLATNIVLTDRSNNYTATSLGLTSAQNTPLRASVFSQVASGLTQYRSYLIASASVSTGYLGFSAEL
jgi:hypothetical protein